MLSDLGYQGVGTGAGGIAARSFTSSFDSTTSGLSETKPVSLKPDLILIDENLPSCTFSSVSRKSFFVNMIDVAVHQDSDVLVRKLIGGRTTNFKQLDEVRGVSGHAEMITLFSLHRSWKKWPSASHGYQELAAGTHPLYAFLYAEWSASTSQGQLHSLLL